MSVKRELLFLSHRIPFPPDKGDKIRAHAILKHLARRYTIHLGCFVDDPGDMEHCDNVRARLGGECIFLPLKRPVALARAFFGALRNGSLTEGYFTSPVMRRWIESLVRRRSVDKAVIFGSAMAPYVLQEIGLDPSRCVLDMVDVDSDKWAQYARASPAPNRWLYQFEARRLSRLERKAARAFGHTVLVSPHEAATFTRMAPESGSRIRSICNGVDLTYFNPDLPLPTPYAADEIPIVMTGLMDYWPNVQGAEWFARCVFPHIVARVPRAKFYAVGANPKSGFLKDLGAQAVVTGRVPDVRPYLAHASVAIAPLLIARGVQNKVLEAMAMRRAVIATTAATRALPLADGSELLIQDCPELFAKSVLEVLNGTARSDLGSNARDYVERHHGWNKLMAGFELLLESGNDRAAKLVSPVKKRPVSKVARG